MSEWFAQLPTVAELASDAGWAVFCGMLLGAVLRLLGD